MSTLKREWKGASPELTDLVPQDGIWDRLGISRAHFFKTLRGDERSGWPKPWGSENDRPIRYLWITVVQYILRADPERARQLGLDAQLLGRNLDPQVANLPAALEVAQPTSPDAIDASRSSETEGSTVEGQSRPAEGDAFKGPAGLGRPAVSEPTPKEARCTNAVTPDAGAADGRVSESGARMKSDTRLRRGAQIAPVWSKRSMRSAWKPSHDAPQKPEARATTVPPARLTPAAVLAQIPAPADVSSAEARNRYEQLLPGRDRDSGSGSAQQAAQLQQDGVGQEGKARFCWFEWASTHSEEIRACVEKGEPHVTLSGLLLYSGKYWQEKAISWDEIPWGST